MDRGRGKPLTKENEVVMVRISNLRTAQRGYNFTQNNGEHGAQCRLIVVQELNPVDVGNGGGIGMSVGRGRDRRGVSRRERVRVRRRGVRIDSCSRARERPVV